MSGAVYRLEGNQALAVDPEESVWLSASAGTGKTQVLSARVLRLLLRRDVDPSQLLCLTFTKAGAAEMATRVNDVLARWVRLSPELLAKELRAIGASVSEETQSRARSLFASVLDCPGGGLRIDTIHAFAQWLLAAFPEEAGLMPGTRAMEDRDRDLLAHQVLAGMVADWDRENEHVLLDALAMLSVRMGADGVQGWLMRCAKVRDAWFGTGAWQDDLSGRVKSLLGLSADAGPKTLQALCADEAFAVQSLQHCARINAEWGTKTGLTSADTAAEWLAAGVERRVALLDGLASALFTQAGDPRSLKSLAKIDPSYAEIAARVATSIEAVREIRKLLDIAEWLAPALRVGRRFALRWEAAKEREGFIDFDDQIRRAAALLSRADVADWIRYKLDRQFDHILVDEAQDTNEAQWSIIRALTEEYFAGRGQRDDKQRTLFVVGDYKQAIFGFQGTSPENFEAARQYFRQIMQDAADNVAGLRDHIDTRGLRSLGLGRSFRTAQPVLEFVDRAIAAIGVERFGLKDDPGAHAGEDRPGQVVLWDPVPAFPDDNDTDDDGQESWISAPERRMADRIAATVAGWLREGYPLAKGKARNAGPGDIMVLVRKRKELAGLIVARLNAAGVPVAGVDRLRLGAPLAVKDLMAALRFAAQPLDDLSLANLLVSPLIGWSQQDLLEHAYRDRNVQLWDHLRQSEHALVAATVAKLRDLLRRVDYESPQALLHWMLLGPWEGRSRLVARLGVEANDPIDELLNAALTYAAAHTASLHGFIQWFDSGDGELKREAGASEGLVRVMTVHGSKGLQAPIVILADATGNPDTSRSGGITLRDGDSDRMIPVPAMRGDLKAGPVLEAEAAMREAERQEHWRLLYVAMTRAEEALYIGGALGKREQEPAPDSWYAQLAPLFPEDGEKDAHFGSHKMLGNPAPPVAGEEARAERQTAVSVPDWARTPIGPEPRPPRPLAPSSVAEDLAADPPMLPDAVKAAARRGVLIHRLLERLPDLPDHLRAERASAWLGRHALEFSAEEQAEIRDCALQVLCEPTFAEVFAPGSLAEVPIAATVGRQVIAGTIDRLLVTREMVTVVDYKTARRPPASLEQVPPATLRQMAAYVAALEVIYPGRSVQAALLYTHAPRLIAIPDEIIEQHKSALSTEQESFALPDVE